MRFAFNNPYVSGNELNYVQQAIDAHHLSGNGPFTKWCQRWLVEKLETRHALLTHSCTAALEMAAILCDLGPGDEVILPSYTFVSTANAFVLRGAVPVFVDIRPDTLNIDESLIEKAITPRTKVIVPVHYAGVPCEMDAIMDIAKRHGLLVIEDAAQAILSRYKGRPAGSIGDLGCLSFHETKNIHCGEGGALLVNNPKFIERSEIIWEKGTNRSSFFRGEVDKYTWVDLGSSFLPSEMNAAFLRAQLENAERITGMRLLLWREYFESLLPLRDAGALTVPAIPEDVQHNGHLFYAVLPSASLRDDCLEALKGAGVGVLFHYVPLHSSPAGLKYGRSHDDLPRTRDLSERILRFPLWPDLLKDPERPSRDIGGLMRKTFAQSSLPGLTHLASPNPDLPNRLPL